MRQYCTRRISRSKKALGIQQDLKSQSLKIETTPTIQSAKHYEVILFQAERAWSYGMQFKTSILKVQKHHSMKRLSRAVFYSKCLSDQTKLLDFDVASTIQINVPNIYINLNVSISRRITKIWLES